MKKENKKKTKIKEMKFMNLIFLPSAFYFGILFHEYLFFECQIFNEFLIINFEELINRN